MATTTQVQTRGGLCGPFTLIFFVGILLLAFVILMSGLPALNDHAVERHESAAVDAWGYINSLPSKDFCKWQCNDGRTRYMCNVRGTDNWAVAVVEDGQLITAFLATQHYARGIIEGAGCNANPLHYNHP